MDINGFLLEGKVEGVRCRGAPRNMWTRDIIKWTKLNYVECVRSVWMIEENGEP